MLRTPCRRLWFCCPGVLLLPCQPRIQVSRTGDLPTEMPVRASEFMETVGLNVHLHNANTLYGNFPLIFSAITDLHVEHLRDGLINTTWNEYYTRHAALAQSGVHSIFITGGGDTVAQMNSFVSKVGGAAEGLEAPNESDNGSDPLWAPELRKLLPRLQSFAQGRSAPALPILGPSLVKPESYLQVRDLRATFAISNLHNYFAGWNPGTAGWGQGGYGSIEWNKDAAERAWGPKPLVSTETGYATDLGMAQAVPEEVQALYVPRLFLEQFLHGIQRTYLYELADGNDAVERSSRSFGLLRADGSRKPAFLALQRLTTLLEDGPVTQPAHALSLIIDASPPELHHLLLEKRNGIRLLAFWLEVPVFDPVSKRPLPVSNHLFTLHTTYKLQTLQLISLDPTASSSASLVHTDRAGDISLTATGVVELLCFKPLQ